MTIVWVEEGVHRLAKHFTHLQRLLLNNILFFKKVYRYMNTFSIIFIYLQECVRHSRDSASSIKVVGWSEGVELGTGNTDRANCSACVLLRCVVNERL